MNGEHGRLIGLTAFCLLLAAADPAVAQGDPKPAEETAAIDKESARRLRQMVEAAADYELSSGRDGEHLLKRLERPVLRWSNPIRATDDGAVFLWTDQGRPAAALCVYNYGADGVDHEWQSLAAGPLRASYRKTPVWRPQAAGIEYRRVPGDSELPADTPVRRLRQMRSLLGDFAATVGREPLRTLTQPLYRYGDQESEVLDGAIFAFAQATDPELLLLLEARGEKQQPAAGWGAAARMTVVNLELKHRGETAWTAEWHQRLNDRQPYMTFPHKRGEAGTAP